MFEVEESTRARRKQELNKFANASIYQPFMCWITIHLVSLVLISYSHLVRRIK